MFDTALTKAFKATFLSFCISSIFLKSSILTSTPTFDKSATKWEIKTTSTTTYSKVRPEYFDSFNLTKCPPLNVKFCFEYDVSRLLFVFFSHKTNLLCTLF